MLSTDQKGAIAETAIIHEATKLGIGVFKAVNDGSRYDLIFDLRGKLIRVQCKWATRYKGRDRRALLFLSAVADRHAPPQIHG